MAIASHIIRKSSVFHLRIRIPLDLVGVVGRQEFRRSLGTGDVSLARIVGAVAAADVKAMLVEIRMASDAEEQRKRVEALLRRKADLATELASTLGRNVELAQEIGSLQSIRDGRTILRLSGAVAALAAAPQPSQPPAQSAPFVGLHEDARRPLDELLTAFLKDSPQKAKRQAEYEVELARWRRAVGDKPVALIERRDVIAYHDLLLDEVKPRKGGAVASWDTQNKALSCIRMVLGWATDTERRRGDLPTGRVSPKGVSKAERERVKRRPWRDDELTKIFAAPIYTGCRSEWRYGDHGDAVLSSDGRYWLPLVALMTGARLGELMQLRVSDVVETSGVVYLNVTTESSAEDDDEDRERTAKTENSIRMLPVHPELGRLGIARYIAERRRADPTGLLFEARDYGKFFNDANRFFDRVGVKSDVTSFHSFRHVHKDMLRALRDADLRDRLMGHAPRSVGETYGSPLTPDEVSDFFEKVRSPIDLSHLYPAGGKRS